MQKTQETLPNGTIIREHYRIESLIGGNSGPVYRVHDLRIKGPSQSHLAFKDVGGLNVQERYDFAFAGVALRKLRHTALPRFLDVLRDEKRQRVCIVMEYAEGIDLETLWQQQPHQQYAWSEVQTLLSPVFDAVEYMHQQHPPVVHRDIKPVNIIVSEADGRTRLVDIGIVRSEHVSMSPNELLSSYKAPELYMHKQNTYESQSDARADIYALAATCYALLTGTPPPASLERLGQVEQRGRDPLVPASKVVLSIPIEVSEAIQKALSLEPSQRFTSVQQFWNAMNTTVPRQAEMHKHVSTTPTPKKRAALFSSRGIILACVFFALLLSAIPFVTDINPLSFLANHAASSTATTHKTVVTPAPSSKATTPASGATTYTNIAGLRAGTIYDIVTNVSTTIAIDIEQQQGTLRGTIVLGPKMQGGGPFTGTIDASQRICLYVTGAKGQVTLFIEGSVQSASSLSGDYYSCAPSSSGTTCHRSDNSYGLWNTLTVK